jgi:hypothetical protein
MRNIHCHPCRPEQVVELHEPAAQRVAHDQGGGRREVDEPDDRGAVPLREPEGDHVHQGGIEPGLGRAEQEPHDVERDLALDEHHQSAQRTPGDRDPGDPPSRTHPEHGEVARDLEERVADEEDARAEAEGRRPDPDVGRQVCLGQRDVGAVDVGHEVDPEHDGKQAEHHLPRRAGVQRIPLGIRPYGGHEFLFRRIRA